MNGGELVMKLPIAHRHCWSLHITVGGETFQRYLNCGQRRRFDRKNGAQVES